MEVDYLISGAGASGLAFLDTLVHESDATVAIVDRRDAPGGHWVDAYPFVNLHQPSSFYGVNSKPLGQNRLTATGINRGLPEVASKHEILHYFRDLMDNTLLPTGRVTYLKNSEHLGDGRVRSLVTGEETQITVRKKFVDAGYFGEHITIPATHDRPFDVDPGVDCVPLNDLPKVASQHEDFVVLGAGKTAMDAVLWLLETGIPQDKITWVRPNDYWIFQRDFIVPHRDFFDVTVDSIRHETESLATSKTVEEHCLRLEAEGRWQRIDRDYWPTRFHAATCSNAELEALRTVENVVRLGRVKRITATQMELAEGTHPISGQPLFVDCTGAANISLDRKLKVFDGNVITLMLVRPFQPVFSSALIAHLECGDYNDTIRQFATQVTNFHHTPADYIAVQRQGFMNQYMWNQNPAIRAWVDASRLNAGTHLTAHLTREDTEQIGKLKSLGALMAQAVDNIPKMLAASADS